MDGLSQLRQAIQERLDNEHLDVSAHEDALTALKLEVVQLSLSRDPSHLLRARSILECACLFSAVNRDFAAFERHFSQLRVYYSDHAGVLAASEEQWQITGLYLLFLVTQNRISEFHCEIELIAAKLRTDNPFVRYAVEIEQWLSEGAYKHVLVDAKPPSPIFSVFSSAFLHTIREKIALCCASAYKSLKLESARTLLVFDSLEELAGFVEERGWKVVDGEIRFEQHEEEDADVPSMRLISQTLAYAKELETIV